MQHHSHHHRHSHLNDQQQPNAMECSRTEPNTEFFFVSSWITLFFMEFTSKGGSKAQHFSFLIVSVSSEQGKKRWRKKRLKHQPVQVYIKHHPSTSQISKYPNKVIAKKSLFSTSSTIVHLKTLLCSSRSVHN